MNKLKAVGAGIGALAMIWAGTSYYLGGKVIEVFAAQVEIMTSAPFVSATISRTERGWFRSEIDLTVKYGFEQDNGKETLDSSTPAILSMGPVTITYELDHGPIIFGPNGMELAVASIDHRLKIAEYLESLKFPDLDRNIIDSIPPDYNFHAWVKFTFDGTLYAEFDAVPLNIVLEPGGSPNLFKWGGLSGTINYNYETKRYAANFDIPTMGFQSGDDVQEVDIHFDRFHIDMDVVLEGPMVWLGDINFAIGKFAVDTSNEKGVNAFSMDGLTVKSTSTSVQLGALINSTVEFRLDAVTGLEKVTEGLAVGPIEWKMEFNNQPRDAYENYLKFIQSINAEQDPEELAKLFPKALRGYLTADPEFNITKASSTMAGEPLHIRINLPRKPRNIIRKMPRSGWPPQTMSGGWLQTTYLPA